ncbi:MAG: S-layer homology domain-containing protein [Clostridia bacterium]|nr:S-layer homology domain-containing protein [Clostridia bacterium]
MKHITKILSCILIVAMLFATPIFANDWSMNEEENFVYRYTYEPSEWAKEASTKLKIVWYEAPTRPTLKGEVMFSILRTIQASRYRRGIELLSSNTALTFYDAEELCDTATTEAKVLVDLGVLTGYQNYMSLTNVIKRSEASKVITFFNPFLELPVIRSAPNFGDISGHWARSYINYACSIGALNGKGADYDGIIKFAPDADLTLEQLVQILYNVTLVNSDITLSDVAKGLKDTFFIDTTLDLSVYEGMYNDEDNGDVTPPDTTPDEVVPTPPQEPDDDYDYKRTIIYVEGYEPSTYYNAWVDDTIKLIIDSDNGKLEKVTLSNNKCSLTKDISSLDTNKYTFTLDVKVAGSCILYLDFEDGTNLEFTINSCSE